MGVMRQSPDSRSVACEFPSRRGAPQRNSIAADPLATKIPSRSAASRRNTLGLLRQLKKQRNGGMALKNDADRAKTRSDWRNGHCSQLFRRV